MAQPHVNIFFGSQTGTAECFSEEIRDEAAELGINAQVVDLDKFTPESFVALPLTILVVSTYGDGEPTDNAKTFHAWAMDPRNDGQMQGRRFCVMGLGDMNYTRFNNMGQMTDANLERLGGTRIYSRGVGDDSQDIVEDFRKWKDGGLWQALKKAIEDITLEGGYDVSNDPQEKAASQAARASIMAAKKPDVYTFFAHDADADGAAKDVCELAIGKLKDMGVTVPLVQTLSDRKAVEALKKIPKKGFALVVVDASPEGMCGPGRKLARNMQIELDLGSLAEKEVTFSVLTVASSKCNNSAIALRPDIERATDALSKAFDRIGCKPISNGVEGYIDAGVADVGSFLDTYCSGIYKEIEAATAAAAAPPAKAAKKDDIAVKVPTLLCTGEGEAREAGDALAGVWPNGKPSVDIATLQNLLAAVQTNTEVVIAVECAADGSLSDAARGFAMQLTAIPLALKAQLKQLRFALLAVAATDYGNAGERASANAMRAELTRAATPIMQSLTACGSRCVCQVALDLQDSDETALVEQCKAFSAAFVAAKGSAPGAAVAIKPPSQGGDGTLSLHMALSDSELPAEPAGEPSDVLAKFYFEAVSTNVTKVRELRQAPDANAGLSTVEVEISAAAALRGYSVGGTLSLLPHNDPADVNAMLRLLGLSQGDLAKKMTFTAGGDPSAPVKRPFPTPCSVGDALARYCDLARAPTKKMLTSLQDKVRGPGAQERLANLLADAGALDFLRNSPMCCRMHEFWALLGVTGIALRDFLLHCPRQKPREFTIASSPKASPDRITLCVSLTSHEAADLSAATERLEAAGALSPEFRAADNRSRFYGMCSRWLSTRLRTGDKVLAKQRPSPLTVPDRDVPIIMVGAGAGVAPFRGFWEELRRGPQTSPAALFFGCRHPDQDWLFKEEMGSAVKPAITGCAALQKVQAAGAKRPLTCLFTAFSRPGNGRDGQYVQDQLRAQARSVKHWMENMKGMLFICGSTAMGNAVLDVLAEVLEGGNEKVEELRKSGQIVAEMWG